MYVLYESKHRHINILGMFGNVLGAFGGVWLERLGTIECVQSVWERMGAYGSVWQARQGMQAWQARQGRQARQARRAG